MDTARRLWKDLAFVARVTEWNIMIPCKEVRTQTVSTVGEPIPASVFVQNASTQWFRVDGTDLKIQDVLYMGVHINHLLGSVPSTLNPL